MLLPDPYSADGVLLFVGKYIASRLVSSFCCQLSFISPLYTAVFSSSDCAAAATTTTTYLRTYLLITYLFTYYLLIYLLGICCSDVLCSVKMNSCVGYRDSLKDGRPGERIPVGARFFSRVQTGPGDVEVNMHVYVCTGLKMECRLHGKALSFSLGRRWAGLRKIAKDAGSRESSHALLTEIEPCCSDCFMCLPHVSQS